MIVVDMSLRLETVCMFLYERLNHGDFFQYPVSPNRCWMPRPVRIGTNSQLLNVIRNSRKLLRTSARRTSLELQSVCIGILILWHFTITSTVVGGYKREESLPVSTCDFALFSCYTDTLEVRYRLIQLNP